jgi:hypothetical protein
VLCVNTPLNSFFAAAAAAAAAAAGLPFYLPLLFISPQLFEALKSRQPGGSDWDDLVAFLQEFCSLTKPAAAASFSPQLLRRC